MNTLQEIAARAAEIATELEGLEDVERAAELATELEQLEARRADIEARSALVERARNVAATETAAPTIIKRAGDPFDMSTVRAADFQSGVEELRSRAVTAVERTDWIEDEARAEVVRKLEKVKDPRGVIPGLVLYTGNPEYQRAFHKSLAGRTDLWTNEERTAVMRADQFRTAMSLTDANGGYAIPFTLDPTLILTSDGSTNPFRRACRVETITTDTWNGLSSAGVTASFDGGLTEVSDDSPTFAQPTATPKLAQAFVQGSVEIAMDYRNLATELAGLFADAKDNLEATIFSTLASYGLVPLVTGYDSGTSIKTSAATDTFAVADVYNTFNQTPARSRSKGVWFMNNSIISLIRQFATANNYHAFLTDLGGGQPSQLLGQPVYESSAMDGTINTTVDNYIIVHGDPMGYLIADRVGLAVEYIPHLFNTSNNLPDGRRGWYAYWRTGTALLNGNGFTVLNVT